MKSWSEIWETVGNGWKLRADKSLWSNRIGVSVVDTDEHHFSSMWVEPEVAVKSFRDLADAIEKWMKDREAKQ